jgi:hypothetical protein
LIITAEASRRLAARRAMSMSFATILAWKATGSALARAIASSSSR